MPNQKSNIMSQLGKRKAEAEPDTAKKQKTKKTKAGPLSPTLLVPKTFTVAQFAEAKQHLDEEGFVLMVAWTRG